MTSWADCIFSKELAGGWVGRINIVKNMSEMHVLEKSCQLIGNKTYSNAL